MPDRLEEMLDALAADGGAPPPPAPFLRAVARRRWQRRAAGVAGAAAVVALTGMVWVWQRPAPAPPAPRTLAVDSVPETSARALALQNADRSVENLVLPKPAGGGPGKALRFGMRVEPAEIERWVCQ
jgi:hypothetical protein